MPIPSEAKIESQLPLTVQLRRRPNSELREREYLTPAEVDRLLVTAKRKGLHAHRNYTLILASFRHGLRVGEAIALKWSSVDFRDGVLHVRRLKRGKPAAHPISGPMMRALRQLQREYPDNPHLFVSGRDGAPLTAHTVRSLVRRLGIAAGFEFTVHPHQLRHACGYYLAANGHDLRSIQDYLGHRNVAHTVRYTELAPGRFNNFWND